MIVHEEMTSWAKFSTGYFFFCSQQLKKYFFSLAFALHSSPNQSKKVYSIYTLYIVMSTVMSDFLLYISHELFQRELHVEEY